MLKVFLLSLGWALPLIAVTQATPLLPPRATYEPMIFMFFVTGKDPTGLDAEEIQQMQVKHLENLGRLGEEGKAVLAGPCRDPDGYYRGIVVLTLPSIETAMREFDADPYIQNELMGIEMRRWMSTPAPYHEAYEPFELDQLTLVLFQKTDKEQPADSSALLSAHFRRMETLEENGTLLTTGRFADDPKFESVAILREPDVEKATALFADDPLVKEGYLRIKVMNQFVAKGVFRSDAE